MKQVFKDISMLMQERKAKVLLVVFVAIGLFLLNQPAHNKHQIQPKEVSQLIYNNQNEGIRDLQARYFDEIEDLKRKLAAQARATGDLNNEIEVDKDRIAKMLGRILDVIAENSTANPATSLVGMKVEGKDSHIESIDDSKFEYWGQGETINPVPPQRIEQKEAIIAPGNTARLRLLAGALTNTDGTPYPVLAEVIGDIRGPNGTRLPVGNANIVMACQGSLIDSRAICRLVKMTIVLPSRAIRVLDVDGWIVGEDGVRGIEGILRDPISQEFKLSMLSGGVHGLGRGIEHANQQTTTGVLGGSTTVYGGSIAQLATGGALQGATDEIAKIISQRMAQLQPAVEVYSGREITAVFTSSVIIPGLYQELANQIDFDD